MWEYSAFLSYRDGEIPIERAGLEGWEAYQVIEKDDGTYLYFCKRRIPLMVGKR